MGKFIPQFSYPEVRRLLDVAFAQSCSDDVHLLSHLLVTVVEVELGREAFQLAHGFGNKLLGHQLIWRRNNNQELKQMNYSRLLQ